MSLVAVVSPVNAYVFTEYIRPRLQTFIAGPYSKASPLVRATYASCLATLAHSSSRILDMVQALRADGSIPTIDPEAEDGIATDTAYHNLYDVARLDLEEHFEAHTKALLTDSDASVRRAFLGSVSSLCVFFGSSKANDVVLSHLNTYLNDKDWILKCAFFQTIVGVATFVGGTSLEEFILPLMIQALTDPEESVVEKVLSSLANMAELGLFQRSKIWEMVDVVARFLMHPNIWIREAAAQFISASTRYLSVADIHCIISPLIQPYLILPIIDFAETNLLDALQKPLSRPVLELAAMWATKVPGGLFWKPIQQQRTFSFGSVDQAVPTTSSKDLRPNALSKIPKKDEDEQWLNRLRNLGMGTSDDFKLLALREYIWRMAPKRPREGAGVQHAHLNRIINLKEIKVMPQTIFFESRQRSRSTPRRHSRDADSLNTARKPPSSAPHTIADALLDASTTINDPIAQRKKQSTNARKERLDGNSPPRPVRAKNRPDSSNLPSPLSSSPSRAVKSRDKPPSTDAEPRRAPNLHFPIPGVDNNPSEGTLTPTDSLKTGSDYERGKGIRHKSSAINLLNRRDTSKTVAETGTTSANAFGKLDGPYTREPSDALPNSGLERGDKKQNFISQIGTGHTYVGNDPNVLKLLDSLAAERQSLKLTEFGPTVAPISSRHKMKKADSQDVDRPWRPEGVLVATFGEHTGPINRVLPSPDHTFFLTGSDDGTVKIWDTLRLERNLAHRSRQTHRNSNGAKVKCLAFVENTYTFVSGATDGSINVVRVDCNYIGDTTKYGKLRLVREYQLPKDEYAVWLDHFKSDGNSILLIATNTSRIIALDLRDMSVLYTLENPVHHGTPTCFCVDIRHGWLLLGTSHGVLDLWDLRFRLRLRAWGLSGGRPIHRIHIHPFKGRGRWVCVAGGTGQPDITIWDLEKAECREVFRAGITRGSNKDSVRAYEPWKVDDEKPEEMLSRFAAATDPSLGNGTSNPDRGIRALALGLDAPEDGRESKYGFFLTGGADKKLRFWDVTRVETSMVISGLDADEDQPKFTTSHPTTMLTLNTERVPQPGPSAPNAAAGSNSPAKKGARPPRSTVISAQQQQLLRSHLDTILDVAILEHPVGMTVSVDRQGVIYVFQ